MKIECSECGLRYRIDPEKITAPGARFKCKGCATVIYVDKKALPGPAPLSHEDEGSGNNLPPAPGENTQELTSTHRPPEPGSPKPFHLGLTAKVIFLMLTVSLIPGGIFFALSSKFSHDRILAQTDEAGIMVAGQLAFQIDEWIDKNLRCMKALAETEGIRSMASPGQEGVLQSFQRRYPWIYLAFTTDIHGNNIARSDGNPLKDYTGRHYIRDIADGREDAWQNLIGKTSGKPALVLAVPIEHQGQHLGVLAAAMTRDAISERVATLKTGNTGFSFLVDTAGLVVAHQNKTFVIGQKDMSTHPLVMAAKNGKKGRIEFRNPDGDLCIGFTHKTALGWILAVQQNKTEALAPLKKARNSALILLAATLVVVVLIALFAAKTIVTPIRALTDAANRISVGDLDVEIKTRSRDEIGELAEAVTRLQDSIRISISRLRRLR